MEEKWKRNGRGREEKGKRKGREDREEEMKITG
jgi:hypothetical protein